MKEDLQRCRTTTRSKTAESAVRMIWSVLASRYKHSWTSGHIDNDITMQDWCEAISGLRKSDLQRGLQQIKVDDRFKSFPPNSMEFRDVCINDEGEKERLLNELLAWDRLEQKDKSRAGLYLVRSIDLVNFRRADYKTARRMFDASYRKMKKHLAGGGELPEFALEIEHKREPALPKEELSKELSEILSII